MSISEIIMLIALNIYHEARGETVEGKLAIAHVTLNRADVADISVEEVVMADSQFSWTNQLDNYDPKNTSEYAECIRIAKMAFYTEDNTNDATYYHKYDIMPHWANTYAYIGRIGNHVFYEGDYQYMRVLKSVHKHKPIRALLARR